MPADGNIYITIYRTTFYIISFKHTLFFTPLNKCIIYIYSKLKQTYFGVTKGSDE